MDQQQLRRGADEEKSEGGAYAKEYGIEHISIGSPCSDASATHPLGLPGASTSGFPFGNRGVPLWQIFAAASEKRGSGAECMDVEAAGM